MNMSNKSIAKNYIYNMIYQLFKLFAPLIVTPYIARRISEVEIGMYSFSYSITSFFVLFASMGFSIYGQRLVASHQGDKHKQSIDFYEIMFCRLAFVVVATMAYIIFLKYNNIENRYLELLKILIIDIVSVAFDVSFFLQGNEEFDKCVICCVFVRLITYICLFVFIKIGNSNNLYLYVVIQSLSGFFTNFLMCFYLPKSLCTINKREVNIVKHIKPAIIIFLPTFMATLNSLTNKTILGLTIHNDAENGYFEYADKIVSMLSALISALGIVLIPRNSRKHAIGDTKAIENNMFISIQLICIVGIPAMFGCIAIADDIVLMYLGKSYFGTIKLLKILSPTIVLTSINNVIGLQYLIPTKQDNKYSLIIISGFVIRLLINLLFVSSSSIGVALSSVISDILLVTILLLSSKKELHIKKLISSLSIYFFAGALMFSVCKIINIYIDYSIEKCLFEIVVSVTMYIVLLIQRKERIICYLIDKYVHKNEHAKGLFS